jgi:hypothetical protein
VAAYVVVNTTISGRNYTTSRDVTRCNYEEAAGPSLIRPPSLAAAPLV